ncbi:MAG: hypothetical protein WCI02_13275 [Planctomycetota bacterium]
MLFMIRRMRRERHGTIGDGTSGNSTSRRCLARSGTFDRWFDSQWNSQGQVAVHAILCMITFAGFGLHGAKVVFGKPPQEEVQVNAILHQGLGVGSILIPADQIAKDATVRVITKEKNDRIFYPAVEILTVEPAPEINNVPPRGANQSPRIGGGALIKRLRSAIERVREHVDPPEYVRVHFLFQGTHPLEIELTGDLQRSVSITPLVLPDVTPAVPSAGPSPNGASGAPDRRGQMLSSDPRWKQMLNQWWAGYTQQTQRQIERSDYPSLIERYLVNMLGNRFGYPIPELTKPKPKMLQRQTDPLPTLSLVAGVESLRDSIRQDQLSQSAATGTARVPIPTSPAWRDTPLPSLPNGLDLDAVPIERIASAVPPDCLYIRFRTFANYLWFQQLSESRGGDLAQLALLRGFNYETNDRIERMLSTKLNYVSKLFGDAVINEMAIVGYDLYLQEGPTMGVIFEAKNFSLLQSSFRQEREATVQRMVKEGCTLETVEIEGRAVSLLSTPDNVVRSYLIEADPFLFVTTSQTLARRFIQVQNSGESMAMLPAYRFARVIMPEANRYDVFAYFSSEFFRNLISPQYQIELRRRLRAIAAIETAETAALVADSERQRGFVLSTSPPLPDETLPKNVAQNEAVRKEPLQSDDVDRLIEDGYLPNWFQQRVDGSESIRFGGMWQDSVRGKRGSFLPIADVPLQDCTPEEAAEYRNAAEFYARQWQETDPFLFGLRRFEHPTLPKVERIGIEAYVAPLGSEKYGRIGELLAPPLETQVLQPADDVVSVQAHLRGFGDFVSQTPNHFLFAGIKDVMPPLPEETKGLLATLRMIRSLPVYIGAWPKPAYLDRLPLGLGGGPPDLIGFSRTLIGMWRWQMGGFSVISFDRDILETCAASLMIAPAEDVAQGRLLLKDLSKSKMAGWFNTFSFRQAAQTTRGNLLLLDSVQQQLGVPLQGSRATAERLLDAKLQCTLGGEYQIDNNHWTSTAWPRSIALAPGAHASKVGFDPLHSVAPEGYQAPWLQWFRGAQLHLTQTPERLIVVGYLDMEPLPPSKRNKESEAQESSPLPKLNFDIYNLPFQMFNSDKPKKGAEEKEKKQKAAPESKRRF